MPGIPEPVLPILAGLDAYDTVFETSEPAGLFNVRLTPLETIARDQAAGGPAH